MEMIYVPPGTFLMGENLEDLLEECKKEYAACETSMFNDEQPIHEVYLDGFWIDRTEVTNDMYALCVNSGNCSPPKKNSSYSRNSYFLNPTYGDYPVIYVSWFQAKQYCEWAGRQLPTEAQWEKAARGPESYIFPWGNTYPDDNLANYDDNQGDTKKVGSYPDGASPYGVVDMSGNVWEWVSDWYGPYTSLAVSNPTGPDYGETRVVKGGSWYYIGSLIRSSYRESEKPESQFYNFGFRCVLVVE
jgi:formylglycine-generating enzyme required for sulfatase activity